MIKESNKTIRITLTKKQADWLDKISADLHLTKSKTIAWLLSKKANDIGEYIKRKNKLINDEDWDELQRIIHTPWIDYER